MRFYQIFFQPRGLGNTHMLQQIRMARAEHTQSMRRHVRYGGMLVARGSMDDAWPAWIGRHGWWWTMKCGGAQRAWHSKKRV